MSNNAGCLGVIFLIILLGLLFGGTPSLREAVVDYLIAQKACK